jgi:signal transduction histidine kinase
MNKKSKSRFFRSVFFKLLVLVVLFGILINLAVWVFLRFSSDVRPKKLFPNYIIKMNEYVVKDIGSPPDTIKANKICEELNINIRYQSHDFNWTSSELIPTLEVLSGSSEFKEHYPYQDAFSMRFENRTYNIFKLTNGIFILAPLGPQDFFNPERAIIILIILISIIFIPLYLFLRRLLNPLKGISSAVQMIGEGKYDIVLNVNRKDELGELADSINDMASKIKNAIKAKEQLLLDVSHELRTPLTRIKLGLEVGSSKEKINEDVKEMEDMVSGLLENYRSEYGLENIKFRQINIVSVLKELISDFDYNERLWFTLPEKEIELNIDGKQIKTVFNNIINNALKYSKDKVEIFIEEKLSSVDIVIKDSGIGIKENDLKLIFEPFYRADRSRSRETGGFGLGLSISKKIIDAHNGKIIIHSKINEGTTVMITLQK